jgi:hypothetical protein
MGKELLYMCRLILSLRAKNPCSSNEEICENIRYKCPNEFWWKNPRTANLDRQSYRGSQQRHTGSVWRILLTAHLPRPYNDDRIKTKRLVFRNYLL